jgi:hypothetical protein
MIVRRRGCSRNESRPSLFEDRTMFRSRLRSGVGHIVEALRDPEAFALRWHEVGRPYEWWVFALLALTSIAGTTTYGMVMGILGGPNEMALDGLRCTAAAGIGWSLPLPALYVLNSLSGSRLRPSTTFLAALVTTSWGGLAMISAIPIAWFFSVALPYPAVLLVVHLVVFTAVGVAMIDVFGRVMEKLEPNRGRAPAWWLLLVGSIGGELFYAFGLFRFTLPG